MQKLLEAAGQDMPAEKPNLELNPEHMLVRQLADESDDSRFRDLAEVLFDQASLIGGRAIDDPGAFVRRVNELISR